MNLQLLQTAVESAVCCLNTAGEYEVVIPKAHLPIARQTRSKKKLTLTFSLQLSRTFCRVGEYYSECPFFHRLHSSLVLLRKAKCKKEVRPE